MSISKLGLVTLGKICGHDIHQRELDGKIEVTPFKKGDEFPSFMLSKTIEARVGKELVEIIEDNTGRASYDSKEGGDILWLHPSLFLLYVSRYYATPTEISGWKDEFLSEAMSHKSLSLPAVVWDMVRRKVAPSIICVEPEDARECVGYTYLEPDSITLKIGDAIGKMKLTAIERSKNKTYLYLDDGSLIVQELLDSGHVIGLTYTPVEDILDKLNE